MDTSRSLDFTIGPFPVRVHLSFLLVTVLIGFNVNNLFLTLTWVLVVFVSILVHELGHALVAEYYQMFPIIQLYSMGGLTIPGRSRRLTHLQEILLSLAGPLAGFILCGLVYLAVRLVGSTVPNLVYQIMGQLLWVNIGWGVLNLIPMLPLDGGQVMRNLWQWFRRSYDERTPLMISIGVGVLVIIAALLLGQIFGAMLGFFFTFNNFMALRSGRTMIY
jgi:Zn-dependent protease